MVVAFCGVLPDLLSPHLSLDSRHTALSHTVWAWILFGVLILIARRFAVKFLTHSLTLLCVLSYGGHIACDYITGGVSLFYPLHPAVQGDNYLPYWLWITCDGFLLIYLYLVYRWLPLRKRIRERKASSPLATTMTPGG